MKRAIILGCCLVMLALACSRGGKLNNRSESGEMSAAIPAGPIIYVALGDSTGSGVGAREGGYVLRLFNRLNMQRPGSELKNLCVSGATTADLIRRQLEPGIAANPHLVTVGIGINDVGHNVGIEEFAQNFETILSTVRSKTSARIVVSNLPDISSAPQIPSVIRQQYQQQITDFNQRVAEISAKHGAVVFDVYSITHAELPGHPEYFSADGFHPSDKGYELWAEKMWPTLESTLNR